MLVAVKNLLHAPAAQSLTLWPLEILSPIGLTHRYSSCDSLSQCLLIRGAGKLQQAESAQLADQVCGLLGGCQGILGTGDNFYQCVRL